MDVHLVGVLQTLERETGRLLPDDVIEAARDPSSPLHPYFTWDDTEAAIKQRRHEARQLIRRVKIEITHYDHTIRVCPYIRDPESNMKEAGYRNVTSAMTDEDLARSFLVNEMNRIGEQIRRAKNYAIIQNRKEVLEYFDHRIKGWRGDVQHYRTLTADLQCGERKSAARALAPARTSFVCG